MTVGSIVVHCVVAVEVVVAVVVFDVGTEISSSIVACVIIGGSDVACTPAMFSCISGSQKGTVGFLHHRAEQWLAC